MIKIPLVAFHQNETCCFAKYKVLLNVTTKYLCHCYHPNITDDLPVPTPPPGVGAQPVMSTHRTFPCSDPAPVGTVRHRG